MFHGKYRPNGDSRISLNKCRKIPFYVSQGAIYRPIWSPCLLWGKDSVRKNLPLLKTVRCYGNVTSESQRWKVYISSPQIHVPRTSLPISPPPVTFQNPPNLHQLIFDMSLPPSGSRPCNTPRCKYSPIHHPTNSFTSSCTNLTYPIISC